MTSQPPEGVPDVYQRVAYLIKELGLTTALVTFICYLLAVQMPSMQADFKLQTDKLVDAVNNNNKAMYELSREMKAIRAMRMNDKNED